MKPLNKLAAILCLLLPGCAAPGQSDSGSDRETPTAISPELSNQFVYSIGEDAQGHIWLGTFRGLNKYDAHQFHQYFAGSDSTTLFDNHVRDIFRDSRGRLWIATVNGVCRYTESDDFKRVKMPPGSRYVKDIVETSDGKLYFNNYDASLMRYDEEADSAVVEIPKMDSQNMFWVKAHPDSDGDLWIVSQTFVKRYDTRRGVVADSVAFEGAATNSFMPYRHEIWVTGEHLLKVFDTRTRRFRSLPEALTAHPSLNTADFEYVHPYGEDDVLLLTAKDGMFLYERSTGRLKHQDDDGFPFAVPAFKIKTIFTDSRRNIWFGSEDQGYAVHYHYKERFNNNNFLSSRLKNKSVVAVAADSANRLWALTKRDGVFIYDPSEQSIENIPADRFCSGVSQSDKGPANIIALPDGDMWITATNNEVLRCSYADGKLTVKERHWIWLPMQMFRGNDGTIWVGTASPYVYYLRPGADKFESVQVFEGFCFTPGLAQFDDSHIMALAFNQPMKLIDTNTCEVSLAPVNSEGFKAAISRSVFIPTAVRADSDSIFWIGTVSNGLLRYRPADGTIERVGGLPCSDVSAIEKDEDGQLWISTLHGMGRLNPESMAVDNFYAYDGIGGNQFYDRASARMQHGTIIFGGTHGLTFFRPEEVFVSPDVPVLFENLKIHNRAVVPGEGGVIDKHMSYNPTVRLRHDQNSFTVSFVALDYCENHRVQCQYRLDGVDPAWVDASDRREASYANVAPGDYTFRVRIPVEGAEGSFRTIAIRIEISPAWWASWWAIAIYILVGMALVYILFVARMRIQAERNAVRQAKMEKEQEQRVNTMNMRFFANVSHEFRTPLTMIAGPVVQLASSPDISGHDRSLLAIVKTNVDRMLQLVNQLLDFNKLDNDVLKLQVRRADINDVLRRVTAPFVATAEQKDIQWTTYGFDDSCAMWLDEDKFIKIYTNLLSNALKYTPRGGTVKTSFDEIMAQGLRFAKITVENSGPGIPADKLEKIFERYYRLEKPDSVSSGSGIGLYYARRLAELHHGSLRAVMLDDGKGACFVVLLPIDKESYSADELASRSAEQSEVFPISNDATPRAESEEAASDKPLVLVVDDDVEVAHYLKTLLSGTYRVVTRFDVDSALEWLETSAPALIISDVVMPGKDGLSLCRQVKDDIRLSHVPLVLVTAKATVENQVEGLNAQADAYVTKPFDPNFMMSLIKSLLLNREKMMQIVNSSTTIDDVDQEILSPHDNAFLSELYQLMEQEIANPELDITNISRMMKISRTKFYYKVKGLTGETPGVFFKTYKLNRAAQLILEGHHTMSEIADMTGFTSLSHFSRSFKKQFGTSPSEYHA